MTSRRGELSVDATELWLLSKALRPLPDKWHGLAAPIPGTASVRWISWPIPTAGGSSTSDPGVAALRRQMGSEGYVEVETPILQPQAGGALARPFVTHANALGIDLQLADRHGAVPQATGHRGLRAGLRDRAATSATRASTPGTAPNSRPSRPITRSGICRRDGAEPAIGRRGGPGRYRSARLTFGGREHRPDAALAAPRAAGLAGGSRWSPAPPERPGGDGPGGVREARWSPAEWGSGKLVFELYDTMLLPTVVVPGVRLRLPGRGFAVGPRSGRPTRRWSTDSSSPSTARSWPTATASSTSPRSRWPVSTSGGRRRPRRPRSPSGRPGLRSCPGVRPAAHGGDRHRSRPSGDAVGRGRAIRDVIFFPILRPESTE